MPLITYYAKLNFYFSDLRYNDPTCKKAAHVLCPRGHCHTDSDFATERRLDTACVCILRS